MNRLVALAVSSLVMLTVASPVVAQNDDDSPLDDGVVVATELGTVELELIDQTFDLFANDDIDMEYRITGDLDLVAELAPPTTTTPPTTTSTTTTSTTTTPVVDSNDGDASTGAPAPATTSATTTTTTTVAPDEEEPPLPTIDIRVLNYPAIDADDDLDGIIGSDPRLSRLPAAIDGIVLLDVRSSIRVESPDSATIRFSAETDTSPSVFDRLEFDDDGIHPIVVELSVDGDVVARHGTVVERRASGRLAPPPIDLAILVRSPDPGPSAPASERRAAVEAFADLVDLAIDTEPGITFDVPPSSITALSEAGRLPEDVTAELGDDEFLTAPATPFDISSAAAVDRVDAFRRQLIAGENDVLQALGQLPVRNLWHTTTPLSGEGAQVLRDLGVRYIAMTDDVYRQTVDDTDDLPHNDRFVPVDLPDGTTMPILIVDTELGALFTEEATDAALRSKNEIEWSVLTVSRLRLEQADAPVRERNDARSHLLAVPGLGAFDPRLIDELARFAATTESIRFTDAASLASTTDLQQIDEPVSLPDDAGPSLEARLDRIAEVQVALASVASMLPDDDDRPAAWERRLDSFVSTSFDDEVVDGQLDELLDEAAELRSGVIPPEPRTFTLTGDASIVIPIGNSLDEPIDVVLRLQSTRLSFPDGDVALTLPANETVEVEIPIEVRSNGTSPLLVDVTTPLGDPLIEPVRFTSRVNALTGLAQVLTGALVLILLAWWFSNWRGRRREAAEQAHPAAG
ncbi:MAG: hypothetical protein AB8G26_03645 [Ilumatobacter sp.]